ncbi:hypothetical protein [Ornithinibacillus halotolerans]|uniref:Uncharacterized protein n=1 Tax=Ornithinibacillus halotolerans TaxID=1274357 RepID=A0A916W9F8_9BACI|nr:hypothetical protein [Ornithinibacillus halotolerans]GGA78507.1 hypothetical protein GCM10008025_22480 [Ornithinibacillus halotolerans]
MQQIEFMKWRLEIDLHKTKEFYHYYNDYCNCIYCLNYMEAVKLLNPNIIEKLTRLGINLHKPIHLSEFGESEEGARLYIGHYHLVGKLVSGEYCTDSEWNDSNSIKVGNFTLGFEKDITLVQQNFPKPVLQLAFETTVPWVLNEKPEN